MYRLRSVCEGMSIGGDEYYPQTENVCFGLLLVCDLHRDLSYSFHKFLFGKTIKTTGREVRVMARITRKCVVTSDYNTPYAEPWTLQEGDKVTIDRRECEWEGWVWGTNQDGESRWVPESFLEISGNRGKVLKDYDATELQVIKGEHLLIHEMESEWAWCTKSDGRQGWLPMDFVRLIPPDSVII